MTNREYRLKYPINAKIKYVPNAGGVRPEARKDIGKQGRIIAHLGYKVQIYLPTSSKKSKKWRTLWKNIKPIGEKNQQLLFDFAY